MKKSTKERLTVVSLVACNTPQQLAEILVRCDAIAKRRLAENKKLRTTLWEIACYDELPEGSKNLSRLDEPAAAEKARDCLEKRRR